MMLVQPDTRRKGCLIKHFCVKDHFCYWVSGFRDARKSLLVKTSGRMVGVGWSSEPGSAPSKPHHQCQGWACLQPQLLREQVCQLRAPGKSHTSLLLTSCQRLFFFFCRKGDRKLMTV